MEEPYAVIPPVRICAGLMSKLSFITINYEEIYGDHFNFKSCPHTFSPCASPAPFACPLAKQAFGT